MNRLYVRTHQSGSGTPEHLLKPLLESFGWQIRTSGAMKNLSDYLLGKNSAGGILSTTTARAREENLLRRFVNNLPYLLKTKGTRAAIRSIFSIYGIPDSFVQIREFGGPSLLTRKKIYYTFDDPIAELKLSGSEHIETAWLNSNLGRKPDSLEISFRTTNVPNFTSPNISGSWTLVSGKTNSSTQFNVFIDSEPSSSYNGRVRFSISGSTGIHQVSSSKLPLFDGDSFTVAVTRTSGSSIDDFDLYVKKSLYTKITHESSASVSVSASLWGSSTKIIIGNEYSGSVDEFRLWKLPLSETTIDHHVRWHESIRGESYTASVDELLVRLPFDRPQDLGTNSLLINFAYTSSNAYGVSYSTASNFQSIASSPYHFEYTEQNSSFEAPSIGYRYDSDKIRFESQSFIDGFQLDRDTRVTKKSFDQSPVDSNKLGVFLSPTTEINRDIVRAYTGFDFMNEIGDPEYAYSSSYAGLKTLNDHYWSRNDTSMNIYDYITLVRQFDKTVFDYIDDVRPVRTKLSKGILFEPHILERSRVPHRRPSRIDQSYSGEVSTHDTGSTTGAYDTLSANLEVTKSIDTSGTYTSYTGEIDANDEILTTGSYDTYLGNIPSPITSSTNTDYITSVKMDTIGYLENYIIPNHTGPNFAKVGYNYERFGEPQSPLGIHAIGGLSEIIYIKDGVEGRKRVKLELINIDRYYTERQLSDGINDGQEGVYEDVIVTESIEYLNVLDITSSFTTGGRRVDGYLPFHLSKTRNLTTGMNNSFYNGSRVTSETTIDGSDPIEVFVSNVGTLKVSKTDRSNDEPILDVE